MSVGTWVEGELFTLRVYKFIASRPDVKWANTYELRVLQQGAGNSESDIQAVVDTAVSLERLIHLEDVRFDRAVFSTYVEDGQPYDPDSFVSVPLGNLAGQRPSGSDAAALQMCLLVRKQVGFGRTGRLLYRRCLAEADITSPAGDPALAAGVATSFNNIFADPFGTGLTFQDALANTGLSHVMAGQAGGITRVRTVTDMLAAGVVVKKYNNRYFDRVLS